MAALVEGALVVLKADFDHGGTVGPLAALFAGLPKRDGLSTYNRFMGINYAATSYNSNTNTVAVDYSKLVVAAGGAAVAGVQNISIGFTTANGNIEISWASNSNGADALATDRHNVLVVNTLTGEGLYYPRVRTRDAAVYQSGIPRLVGVSVANIRVYGFFERVVTKEVSQQATVVPVVL